MRVLYKMPDMLYVHSFSPIEQQLYKRLADNEVVTQMDIHSIHDAGCLQRLQQFQYHDTLIYSYQQLDRYRHLDSFQREIEQIKLLMEYVINNGFQKLVLISYPGAYASSDNMFLQHKGIIEQLFVGSGVSCTILRVQGICSPPLQLNNFHHLFYRASQNQYIIPKRAGQVIYSIQLNHLAQIIAGACALPSSECFDVFDKVSSLKNFLSYSTQHIEVKTRPVLYLYWQSYFDRYTAPTMFELFMRAAVPMYNFRTEKAFSISLHAEMFAPLRSGHTHQPDDQFIIARKEQLIPVS